MWVIIGYLGRVAAPSEHQPKSQLCQSLAAGRKHGYAILQDVEAISEGELVMSTSTLYGWRRPEIRSPECVL
jgi:hypothetical protein